jgi:hypothetical protein
MLQSKNRHRREREEKAAKNACEACDGMLKNMPVTIVDKNKFFIICMFICFGFGKDIQLCMKKWVVPELHKV